jgi:hypothetical protein
MLPKLIQNVEECRLHRLQARAQQIISNRLHKFQDMYLTRFTLSISPKDWPHLPPVSAIAKFAPVEEALNSDMTVPELHDTVLERVFAEFPRFIEEWKEERVREIRKCVEGELGDVLPGFTMPTDVDVLSLAVATLTCCSSECTSNSRISHGCSNCDIPLLSLDDWLRHAVCAEDFELGTRLTGRDNKLVLKKDTVLKAVKLVEVAGLDPYSATKDDMDNFSMLFTCISSSCVCCEGGKEYESLSKGEKFYGVLVYTWKQAVCIRLCCSYNDELLICQIPMQLTHEGSEFQIVPTTSLNDIDVFSEKFAFKTTGLSDLNIWFCGHCGRLASYQEVFRHLQTK